MTTTAAIRPASGAGLLAPSTGARMGRRVLRGAVGAVLLLVPIALLGLLPRTTGVSWTDVLAAVRSVSVGWLVVLGAVWWAGLVAHSLVLTSSLPGLTSRRAVSLNLAGSAVANSVPLGGALSMGVTTAMARSWGFAPVALGAFLTVSAVWNVLVRLIVGLLALTWLAVTRTSHIWQASGVMLGSVAVAVLLAAWVLVRERSTARLGWRIGLLLNRFGSLQRDRPDRREARETVVDRSPAVALSFIRVRRQALRLIARSWTRLSLGMLGYLALLALLLDLCLRAIGSPQAVLVVVAAVGVERLASAVPLTPGGAGVAELGLVGCLTLCGVAPVTAVAATLIYRLFTFFLEIPAGLLVAAGWGLSRRRAI